MTTMASEGTLKARILNHLKNHVEGFSDTELALVFGVIHQAVQQACTQLDRDGLLYRDKRGRPIRNLLLGSVSAVHTSVVSPSASTHLGNPVLDRAAARPTLGANTPATSAPSSLDALHKESLQVADSEFTFVCDLDPARSADGVPIEFFPHERYRPTEEVRLNPYGRGPFGKFRIPVVWSRATGVYAIVVGRAVRYVGECEDLAARYNAGYGQISPRNCYTGGQNTNCKVNHLLLETAKAGDVALLYFVRSASRFEVEAALIRKLRPIWNGRL